MNNISGPSCHSESSPLLVRFYTDMKTVISVCFFMALYQLSAGCGVEMVSRGSWGAKQPKDAEYMQMPVPHIFIHHTAMGSCSNLSSCSRMMRTIQNLHMDTNGWEDIGYNFLIGGDGRVYVGRGWERVGAHTYGFNRNAVAFSLMGNFVENSPSEVMLNATKMMIQCASNHNYVTTDYQIHGHRDGVCTECPGQALYDIIKTWDRFVGGPIPGYNCRAGK